MPRPPLPRNVLLLGWASLLNDVASEMVYPLLPALVAALGGAKWQLGLMEGFADAVGALLRLPAGAWSDRLNQRRGFVIAGYGLPALSRPLIGLCWLPWQVLALRASDRVGKGLRTAPRDAAIAEATSPDQHGRAFGFHRAMDHAGAALGPLLAAAWLWARPGDVATLFLLTAIPGVAVVTLLAAGMRAAPASATRGAAATGGGLSLRPFDRRFRLYLAALGLFTLGNSTDLFLLTRLEELGLARWLLPAAWFGLHAVKSSGAWLAGGLVDRVGPRRPLLAGWLLYAAIYLGFALSTAAWQGVALFLIYGVYYALAEPAEKTLAVKLAPPEHRGLALGWFHGVLGVAALPASLGFGVLYDRFGAAPAFAAGASLALAASALLALTPGPAPRDK